ncbi:MAG: hypothetical protein M0Z69_13580 [Actinomycetota bacterium]|nr:hypothetical protein [Actinomycetota bacterium]
MRRAGSESWRFAHDLDQTLHALLYIRDALRLDAEEGWTIPPRLAGGVDDRSGLLGSAASQQAASAWPSWWSAALAERAKTELGPGPRDAGGEERLRELADRHHRFADSPEWSSLAEWPALQAAARALWRESCQWFSRARQPYLPPARRDVFAWELVRDAAERAAADHQVSPGAVNGCALVLVVEGVWWVPFSPGVAVCSVSAATSPATTAAILAEVFDSHLAA